MTGLYLRHSRDLKETGPDLEPTTVLFTRVEPDLFSRSGRASKGGTVPVPRLRPFPFDMEEVDRHDFLPPGVSAVGVGVGWTHEVGPFHPLQSRSKTQDLQSRPSLGLCGTDWTRG